MTPPRIQEALVPRVSPASSVSSVASVAPAAKQAKRGDVALRADILAVASELSKPGARPALDRLVRQLTSNQQLRKRCFFTILHLTQQAPQESTCYYHVILALLNSFPLPDACEASNIIELAARMNLLKRNLDCNRGSLALFLTRLTLQNRLSDSTLEDSTIDQQLVKLAEEHLAKEWAAIQSGSMPYLDFLADYEKFLAKPVPKQLPSSPQALANDKQPSTSICIEYLLRARRICTRAANKRRSRQLCMDNIWKTGIKVTKPLAIARLAIVMSYRLEVELHKFKPELDRCRGADVAASDIERFKEQFNEGFYQGYFVANWPESWAREDVLLLRRYQILPLLQKIGCDIGCATKRFLKLLNELAMIDLKKRCTRFELIAIVSAAARCTSLFRQSDLKTFFASRSRVDKKFAPKLITRILKLFVEQRDVHLLELIPLVFECANFDHTLLDDCAYYWNQAIEIAFNGSSGLSIKDKSIAILIDHKTTPMSEGFVKRLVDELQSTELHVVANNRRRKTDCLRLATMFPNGDISTRMEIFRFLDRFLRGRSKGVHLGWSQRCNVSPILANLLLDVPLAKKLFYESQRLDRFLDACEPTLDLDHEPLCSWLMVILAAWPRKRNEYLDMMRKEYIKITLANVVRAKHYDQKKGYSHIRRCDVVFAMIAAFNLDGNLVVKLLRETSGLPVSMQNYLDEWCDLVQFSEENIEWAKATCEAHQEFKFCYYHWISQRLLRKLRLVGRQRQWFCGKIPKFLQPRGQSLRLSSQMTLKLRRASGRVLESHWPYDLVEKKIVRPESSEQKLLNSLHLITRD